MNIVPNSHTRTSLLILTLTLLSLTWLGCNAVKGLTGGAPEGGPDTILATYNDTPFTLDDFETQYAHSVGGRDVALNDSLPAYEDFLERYVDFQLKVLTARDAGLDKDSNLVAEIATYRAQLARPYLLESEVIEPLLRDLYEKRNYMVDASHIMVAVRPDASPADTLAAYNKIALLADSIAIGQDFGDMAFKHSEDPSSRDSRQGLGYRGRLGFFSGGRMVKAFEDQAYQVPIGGVSEIFRSQFGYHILFVHDRIPMKNDIQISHLMIRPAGKTPADTAAALAKMQEVQDKLSQGTPFAELARSYSDDTQTADKGGDLGTLSYDTRLIAPLKEAAFALQHAGDVSEVVSTNYGFHLVALTAIIERPTFEEAYEELKQMVSRLPRSNEAEALYAKTARQQRGETLDTMLITQVTQGVVVDSLRAVFSRLKGDTQPLATIGDSTYTLGQFASSFEVGRVAPAADAEGLTLKQVETFLNARALNYEVAALEDRDPVFKRTMDDFKKGLLLFRLMEDSVWSAASTDSMALAAHFEAHAANYTFGDRTRIVSFYSLTDSTLNPIRSALGNNLSLASVIAQTQADTLKNIMVDTTYVADVTASVFDTALELESGGFTEILTYDRGFILLVNDGIETARNKTFAEARSEVINEYQTVLEDRMIKRLRKKYNVVTYPDRLQYVFNEPPPSIDESAASANGDE